MKEQNEKSRRHLVTDIYTLYRDDLVAYVDKRIHDMADAEDVVQDAFVRLLNMEDMLCPVTVRSLIFTIVRHLMMDRLRLRVKRTEVCSYIYDTRSMVTEEPEQQLYANSLLQIEHARMEKLPPACRKIYYMNRFKEMSISEIAQELHIGKRTVETQINRGRIRMRAYLRNVVGY